VSAGTPAAPPGPAPGGAPASPLAVSVRDLVVRHDSRRPAVTAVDGVTLDVAAGETFAIIGESGSGKSTLLRAIAGLHPARQGSVTINPATGSTATGSTATGSTATGSTATASATAGSTATGSAGGAAAGGGRARGRAQVVFQDPDLALSPRLPVWKSIAEPVAPGRLRIPARLRAEVEPLLREVGLSPALAGRRPHELSGGQRQRVTIARALASRASLLLFDEPVSAQDVSLQASLLRLLARLQRERQLTYLVVSHDVTAVAAMAGRVGVMYAAKLVETGPAAEVLARPRHPYTRALIAAVPRVTAGRDRAPRPLLQGEPPDLARPPSGCRFRARCPFAIDRCASEEPRLAGDGHQAACHRQDDIAALAATTGPATTGPGSTGPGSTELQWFSAESERGGH
jgi:oligopeptide/dipeptide ABC transporter ATP-binding protein